MIILISEDSFFESEANLLNEMLSLEIDFVHLRKPNSSLEEMRNLIQDINENYLHKVKIHQHHELKNDFPKVGLHFTEKLKQETSKYPAKASASFHEIDNFVANIQHFSYGFLSPVFNSISKTETLANNDLSINQFNELDCKKAVALGGVDIDKFDNLYTKGFQNIAVKGAVWQNASPISSLKNIIQKWEK